ncbi:PDZ domain-containing protein [Robiginitalea sp. M366]|uniref:S41 family peptidase n=1 Tax=Robiginitalea aestuariiviva TaxID=3036903 RepID=UPI00240CF42A|nr:S41 family peptidase [Robiginitalea aestuariiviva]MDG1571285.1 PDZ domain-containing protein [Robiginitalea aestuariiviva]
MKSLWTLLLCATGFSATAQGTMLLRQPTVSDSEIVFVYANDLWKSSLAGGKAVRLTSDEGQESFPHFSPDGRQIAFTAEYDGNTDVYIIPSSGGQPQRLTWHPGADVVQGWTPGGKVLFRSSREGHPTQLNRLYTTVPGQGMPEAVNVPRAAFGEISSDGSKIAYTPITFWDPEWRNYRGGQAMPVWIVDLQSGALQRTPQKDRERHLDPVWHQGQVFYISERDYAANIWSFDPATGTEKQHTFHKQFDVKSLDAGPAGIVYEQGGYLHLLNPQTNATQQLRISVEGDMNFARPRWEEVSGSGLENPRLSPNGKRALFEHRGEIFSVPADEGTWRNLSNTSGVADRFPAWSPKGDRIAWFRDASGEYELVVADQMGAIQKTYSLPEPTFFFRPQWSPNAQYIAYTDTHYNIWVLALADGKAVKVATDRYAHPNREMSPVWSPDGKWIAYSRQLNSHYKALFAYHLPSGNTVQLTDGMADALTPAWDASGKYLYFLASTNYALQSGWLDMSSLDIPYTRNLYAIVLSATGKAPTLPRSDEEESGSDADTKGKDAKTEVSVTLDARGIQDRIIPLSLPGREYVGLEAGPEGIVFIAEAVPHAQGLTLHKYEVDKQKATAYSENVRAYVVSDSRDQVLVRQGSTWKLGKSKSKDLSDATSLKTSMQLKVNPREEYAQIFREGWRYMRDFLYVDNVHGAPWDAIYQWYSPWIEHVRHRTDLNYVVDILSGEVAIGHSYVSGGDRPDVDRVPVGLLGCDFTVEQGRYRISHIYTGEQWNPDLYAPLALPGMGIKAGDFLLAINGKELKEGINPYALLEQTAGREIYLTLASNARGDSKREVLVKPVRSESGLRTYQWIEANRRKVDSLSGGKLAYVYVPNTSGRGFESFNRYYFAQQDKKGVIIDERNNGGGFAADYMIDIMDRERVGYFNSKTAGNRPWTTPMAGIWGPKVMLINERAGSGGDLLPYMFRVKKLGPLVGTRTWGGLVGTWDTPRFIDGGRMVAPRGGFFDLDGKWAVEGEGIAPDIEVIQDPAAVLKGHDPQLERGVQEALRLLETQRFELPKEPEAPVRWKRPDGFDPTSVKSE